MEGLYGPGWMDSVCPPDECGVLCVPAAPTSQDKNVSLISDVLTKQHRCF